MGLISYYRRKKGLVCPYCDSAARKTFNEKRDVSIEEQITGVINSVKGSIKGYKKTYLVMCKDCTNKYIICPYCSKITGFDEIFDINKKLPLYLFESCKYCLGKFKLKTTGD